MATAALPREKAIPRLRSLAASAHDIRGLGTFSPEFKKWHRDTRIALEGAFGQSGSHLAEFTQIQFVPATVAGSTRPEDFVRECDRGLLLSSALLASFAEELELYADSPPSPPAKAANSAVARLEMVAERFHQVARQLQTRHAGRPPLAVQDEYDVQDLLHALLHLTFDDIRREEWTPSYAGGASRIDLLLKPERTLVETKMSRPGLAGRGIADQLIIDIQRYEAHPDCGHLFCLVYDPASLIVNPRGLEADLSRFHGAFPVTVRIVPR